MIYGVVLAAGNSRRMGRPKPFLEIRGRTFLDAAIAMLRDGGCDEVIVVTGVADDPVSVRVAEAARAAGALVLTNQWPDSEQVESLRAAIRSLSPAVAAIVAIPVDVPDVDKGVVSELVRRHLATGASVVVPVHEGRRGHPTLFGRALFAELLRDDLPEGARTVIEAHAEEVEEVEVDEAGVLLDVDFPDQYRALMEDTRG
jgi:molybdenum cofactor cytidylyltransferase